MACTIRLADAPVYVAKKGLFQTGESRSWVARSRMVEKVNEVVSVCEDLPGKLRSSHAALGAPSGRFL